MWLIHSQLPTASGPMVTGLGSCYRRGAAGVIGCVPLPATGVSDLGFPTARFHRSADDPHAILIP
jgi:hypothetical protein